MIQQDLDSKAMQGEISLLDILCFLKSTYKTILLFGAAGVVASIGYLAITPKQYEAIAQITMAQISIVNNLSPQGVNIEEPSALIARLLHPTSFPAQVITSCGFGGGEEAAFALSKNIKLTLPKGIANAVELRTFGPSPQVAQSCNEAIVELIQQTQAQLLIPFINEVKIKLADDEERLARAKELLAKVDKSGSAIGAVYLSTRDEIRFLLDEITGLKNVLNTNQIRAARLIAPIYASYAPIAPKKRIVLASGLFGGLFLGLLLAQVRLIWVKLKSQKDQKRVGA